MIEKFNLKSLEIETAPNIYIKLKDNNEEESWNEMNTRYSELNQSLVYIESKKTGPGKNEKLLTMKSTPTKGYCNSYKEAENRINAVRTRSLGRPKKNMEDKLINEYIQTKRVFLNKEKYILEIGVTTAAK